MALPSIIGFAAAFLSSGLALAALILKRKSFSWIFFGLGMLLLAADSALAALALGSFSAEQAVFWLKVKLQVSALLPGTWLLFSLCHGRGNYREFLKQWRLIILASFALPLLGLFSVRDSIALHPEAELTGNLFVTIGIGGKLISLAILLASVLVLVNLERTFRSSLGIMRWRIKYLILGVALIFGARLYTSSQALLYSAIHNVALQVTGASLFLAGLLIAFSFIRTKLADSEIYPSRNVLQHSLTAVVAGFYLVCVGLLANLASQFSADISFPLLSIVLMALVVGLSVVLLSDRLRQYIKVFISRHFHRPVHDHRKVWSTLTERTGALIDQAQLSRAVVKAISDTFELLSVTIWLVRDHHKVLVLGASTAFTEQAADTLVLPSREIEPLIQGLSRLTKPFDIDQYNESWVDSLRRLNPDHFHKGGGRVCVPLVSGGELIGFITVADRVNGLAFSVEDLDLLKCIGDQVAGDLRRIQLSQQLAQNRELQAFQTMSAFFVHDLKNTASTFSLMLQNLRSHFGDPAFRDDCLQSLSRGVARINDLIRRLSLLRHELELNKSAVNLNDVVSTALAEIPNLGQASCLSLHKDLQPIPKVLADPAQLQKVITNLVLNAREAVNGTGRISVATGRENGWVTVSVADTGCGMDPEFVRHSLFKPFQSTKKGGLGIGMFHSKTIVDAHNGRIEVNSTPGEGTTFRILLPLS